MNIYSWNGKCIQILGEALFRSQFSGIWEMIVELMWKHMFISEIWIFIVPFHSIYLAHSIWILKPAPFSLTLTKSSSFEIMIFGSALKDNIIPHLFWLQWWSLLPFQFRILEYPFNMDLIYSFIVLYLLFNHIISWLNRFFLRFL